MRGSREAQAVAYDPWTKFGLPGRAAESMRLLACARACWPGGTAAEQEALALHVALITALDDALEAAPPAPTLADEYRSLLPWHAAPCSARGFAAEDARAPIRAALADLEGCLTRMARKRRTPASPVDTLPGAGPSAIEWWRREAEEMVAAAWQEGRWRSGGIPPDEASYLAVAELSIGARWIAATLLLFEGVVLGPSAGSPFAAAAGAVGAAIRLANDLCDTMRERREGKVQLLFLRSRALQVRGYPPRCALRRARQEVRAMLAERVARARALLDPCQWSGSPRLRAGLACMLDAALDLYGPRLVSADASRGKPGLSSGRQELTPLECLA